MNNKIITFWKQNWVSFQEKLMPSWESKIRTTSKKIIRDKKIFVNYNDDNYEEKIQERLEKIWASIERKKILKKEKKVKEKKKESKYDSDREYMMSLPIWKIDKILRPVFSLAVRLAWAWEENWEWYNYCYTTKEKCLVSKLQAGHRIWRQCKVRKYHIDNVKPQSYGANAKHIGNGMSLEFEGFLRAEWVDVDYMIENKNNKELLDIYYCKEYLVNLYYKCKEFIKSTWYNARIK